MKHLGEFIQKRAVQMDIEPLKWYIWSLELVKDGIRGGEQCRWFGAFYGVNVNVD